MLGQPAMQHSNSSVRYMPSAADFISLSPAEADLTAVLNECLMLAHKKSLIKLSYQLYFILKGVK